MALPAGLFLIETKWRLTSPSRAVGPSLSGRQQVVANLTPLWAASLTFRVPTKCSTAWLSLEAWLEARRGMAVTDAIEVGNLRALWGPGAITFDNFVEFDDACGFEGVPQANISANASQFATQITVDDATGLIVGAMIWIDGEMYRIVAISGTTVDIQPPLRAAVTAIEPISGYDTIDMYLATPDAGDFRITPDAVSDITIEMIEA